MTGTLHTYLPQDRYQALLKGESLPEVAQGAALFADISGFTTLTEQLSKELGTRRGAEEMSQRINAVYQPLIAEIEAYRGSVIGFAGDSITCWFDESDQPAAGRAVACAWAMQQTMHQFEDLALKIAITCGPVRRLVVGDPAIQLLDMLAGSTVIRLSAGEHLAKPGEVLVDESTLQQSGETIIVGEWRTAEAGERFGVLADLVRPLTPPAIKASAGQIEAEALRPWTLPVVFAREQRGRGAFLTELRPAVVLFVRFSGIDYDGDEKAGEKLDAVIRRVQTILQRFAGNLLQLTIGDKGSYFYASFGVPVAHEDDAERAVRAAWAINRLPREFDFLARLQIGLSKGTMRAGAYGGPTRRAYGALGDDTNLAARLMMSASPDEILVSGRVHKLILDLFTCEPRPPLPMKGKAEPLPVFAITGLRHTRAVRLEEPVYTLPMLGREAELGSIQEKLAAAAQGHGQVIGILGEAGMGKSRLVAEAIRLASQGGFAAYGGACAASGTKTAYLVWRSVWQAFFNLDPAASTRRQLRSLEGEIDDRARASIREALEIFQATDSKWGIAYSLVGLAAVSAGQADFYRAIQLASAAEALRHSINLTLERDGIRLYERAISAGRDVLTQADYDAAWESGSRLTIADILDLVPASG
jgi:adenylate cyclase